MNSITREIIERELSDVTFKRDMAVLEVESAQRKVGYAEKRRDELNEQVGALKEDLARAEQRDNINRLRDELLGHA